MTAYKLRKFSEQAFSELVRSDRRLLIGDVGAGKTALTLQAAVARHRDKPVFPMLIVSYIRVINNVWEHEAKKFCETEHLTFSYVRGTPVQRLRALHVKADVYLVNFEILPWLVQQPGIAAMFKSVVVDESTRLSSNRCYILKNGDLHYGGGQQAQALSFLLYAAKERLNWVILLTGTPISRGPDALWGQVWALDFGKALGRRFSDFKKEFLKEIERKRTDTRIPPKYALIEEKSQLLYAAVSHLVSRLDVAKQYPDLPPIRERIIYFDLGDAMMGRYEALKREALLWLSKQDKLKLSIPQAIVTMKLAQFASGFVYVKNNTFSEELGHLIENPERQDASSILPVHDLMEKCLFSTLQRIGRPAIIVYYFEGTRRMLERRGVRIFTADDKEAISAWNRGELNAIGIHWRSGFGLNMQDGGHDMVFADMFYSGELLKQMIARIAPVRQFTAGFSRTTNVYYLIARDTLARGILQVAKGKLKLEQLFLNSL